MLSRILGLIRDLFISFLLGSSVAADAFIVAFRIPNFMRRIFAEGAFTQAFVPVLAEVKQSKYSLTEFCSIVSSNMVFVLAILISLVILFAKYVVLIFAPGFIDDPEKLKLTTDLLQITFSYIGFVSLSALCCSVLNSFNLFTLSSFIPVILNISIILGSILAWYVNAQAVYYIAWSVFIAGALQAALSVYATYRYGIFTKFKLDFSNSWINKLLALFFPAILGASISQINSLIDSIFASSLVTGSVSWLYFADRLIELPIGLVAVSISTAVTPSLAKYYAAGELKSFKEQLSWSIKIVLLVAIPATVGLFVYSHDLVKFLYFRGSMTTHDLLQISQGIQAYSIAMFALMVIKVIGSGFYAAKLVKVPVFGSMLTLVTNITFNYLLVSRYNHVGLAAATSIASSVYLIFLLVSLHKYNLLHFATKELFYFGKLLLSSMFMLVIGLLCQQYIHIIGVVLISVLIYLSMLQLVGINFIGELKKL